MSLNSIGSIMLFVTFVQWQITFAANSGKRPVSRFSSEATSTLASPSQDHLALDSEAEDEASTSYSSDEEDDKREADLSDSDSDVDSSLPRLKLSDLGLERFENSGTKIVFVTGNQSNLGKGATVCAYVQMLRSAGVRVTVLKIDPYLNGNAGTMSPDEHGETFVLDDGGETDLDLGNYERALNLPLTKMHNMTLGKVRKIVFEREERGDYLGKTVTPVPHETDVIEEWIIKAAHQPIDGTTQYPEVCFVEVGGAAGHSDSAIIYEAINRLKQRVGAENIIMVNVALMNRQGKEPKTILVQQSCKVLERMQLPPKIVVCRYPYKKRLGSKNTRKVVTKVAGSSPSVSSIQVLHDVSSSYKIPLTLLEHQVGQNLLALLGFDDLYSIPASLPHLEDYAAFFDAEFPQRLKIALVGKYINSQDAYLSVIEALRHSSLKLRAPIDLVMVDSEQLEEMVPAEFFHQGRKKFLRRGMSSDRGATELSEEREAELQAEWARSREEAWGEVRARAMAKLRSAKGVVIPGGFGHRGFEGKINCAKYCRENGVPMLGVCLGLQVAVVEYARNVLGIKDATSEEMPQVGVSRTNVISRMPDYFSDRMSGTMRLGLQNTKLFNLPGAVSSIAKRLYGGAEIVGERHRHRFEVNPDYVDRLEEGGLIPTGKDFETEQRMEVMELTGHPYYVLMQAHPEFQSYPEDPSPPYLGLLLAARGEFNEEKNADLFSSARRIAKEPTEVE